MSVSRMPSICQGYNERWHPFTAYRFPLESDQTATTIYNDSQFAFGYQRVIGPCLCNCMKHGRCAEEGESRHSFKSKDSRRWFGLVMSSQRLTQNQQWHSVWHTPSCLHCIHTGIFTLWTVVFLSCTHPRAITVYLLYVNAILTHTRSPHQCSIEPSRLYSVITTRSQSGLVTHPTLVLSAHNAIKPVPYKDLHPMCNRSIFTFCSLESTNNTKWSALIISGDIFLGNDQLIINLMTFNYVTCRWLKLPILVFCCVPGRNYHRFLRQFPK